MKPPSGHIFMQTVTFLPWAPPKNQGTSNLHSKLIHLMKASWNLILLAQDAQNLSISTGSCCLTIANLLLLLLSPSLMLCRRYKSKTMSIREHPFDNTEKVCHSALKKSSYVTRFIFFVGTFRTYAIKSIIITDFKLLSGISVGHDCSRSFFSSLASSNFGDFRKSPSFVR